MIDELECIDQEDLFRINIFNSLCKHEEIYDDLSEYLITSFFADFNYDKIINKILDDRIRSKILLEIILKYMEKDDANFLFLTNNFDFYQLLIFARKWGHYKQIKDIMNSLLKKSPKFLLFKVINEYKIDAYFEEDSSLISILLVIISKLAHIVDDFKDSPLFLNMSDFFNFHFVDKRLDFNDWLYIGDIFNFCFSNKIYFDDQLEMIIFYFEHSFVLIDESDDLLNFRNSEFMIKLLITVSTVNTDYNTFFVAYFLMHLPILFKAKASIKLLIISSISNQNHYKFLERCDKEVLYVLLVFLEEIIIDYDDIAIVFDLIVLSYSVFEMIVNQFPQYLEHTGIVDYHNIIIEKYDEIEETYGETIFELIPTYYYVI